MRLLVEFARQERADLRQNGIRVNVIGALEDLPSATRHAVEDLMAYTRDGERMTLTLALLLRRPPRHRRGRALPGGSGARRLGAARRDRREPSSTAR
jgi:hypothetical protein